MTSRIARGSAAAAPCAVPESAGTLDRSALRSDLQRREHDLRVARRRAQDVQRAAQAAASSVDLTRVEQLANEVAAAYRQLATAAWEVARARRELGS